jgi:hypothetical protein
MRHLGVLLAAALAVAVPALADTPGIDKPGAAPPAPPPPKVPLSVWRLGAAREPVEHLQTGMLCDRQVYAYRLSDTHVYDGFGLDVSCSYRDGDKLLTVYLTRAPARFVFAEQYASAKEALLKGSPQRHPTLLTEDKVVHGALNWSRATYAEDEGLHTALWLSMIAPGWILEYRATYPAAAEPTVVAALARISQMLGESAGRRLKLCAASPSPARTGALLADAKKQQELAMMASLLGGAAEANPKAKDPFAADPVAWRPESPVAQGNISMLFWRGVAKDGSDAMIDRVTAMTMGPPPVLEIVLDREANLIESQASKSDKPADRWTARSHEGGQTWIWGYFDGRPSPETSAAFFADMLRGKVKSIGGYRADGKNITISVAPGGKP